MRYLLLKSEMKKKIDVCRGENASSYVRMVLLEVALHKVRCD